MVTAAQVIGTSPRPAPRRQDPAIAALATWLTEQAVKAGAESYPSLQDPRSRWQTPWGGSADSHLDERTRRLAREKSRSLERANMWYDAFLGNCCHLVVGADGPEPMWVGNGIDEDWTARVRDAWWEDAFKRRHDVSGMHTWGALVTLLLRSLLRDGEILHWRDGKGAAVLYENDLLAKVEVDATYGRITALRKAKLDRYGRPTLAVSADGTDGVFPLATTTLLGWRTRVRQTRGAPVCLANLDKWERLGSLHEAEIISAEAASLPWVVLKTLQAAGIPDLGALLTAAGAGAAAAPNSAPDVLAPAGWVRTPAGNMMAPPPGTEATPWTPGRPNLDVPAFVKASLRPLCLPVLPYEVAFMDVESLSYAGIRGLGKLANAMLRTWQASYLETAIDPQAEEWLAAKAEQDRRFSRPEGARLEWRWPVLDIRDREKDASSAERELKLGLTSRQGLLGADASLVRRQLAQEAREQDTLDVERIKKLAAEVADAAVPDLHWSNVATLGGAASAPGAYADSAKPEPSGSQPSPAAKE